MPIDPALPPPPMPASPPVARRVLTAAPLPPAPPPAGPEKRPPHRRMAIGLVMAQVALLLGGGAAIATHDTDTGCPVGKNPAPDILTCLAASTAYIRTPGGTGTGLVYEGPDGNQYLISNAHVVEPYARVDIVLDEKTTEDVPVVGVDLRADISVLGPLKLDAPAITLGPTEDLVQGEDLFLVGYPGETEESPTPTIAQGILSRTRAENDFGLKLLQTDASIGGGQSGGALVDARGDVIGISSLRFAETFALAISSEDVIESVSAILKQEDGYRAWPTEGDAVSASIEAGALGDIAFLPRRDEERVVEFDTTVPAAAVAVDYQDGDVGLNGIALDITLDSFDGNETFVREALGFDGGGLITATSDTKFSLRVPAGQFIAVAFPGAMNDTIVVTASEAFTVYPNIGSEEILRLNESASGEVDSFSSFDIYRIDLTAGQVIRIEVRSPSSDMATDILFPNYYDDPESAFEFLDDADDVGDGGLYGLDVSTTYTAPRDGTYELLVYNLEIFGTAYTIEISDVE